MDQVGVGELESGCRESGGIGADAGEQDIVGHFAEGEAQDEARDVRKSRAVKLGARVRE